MTVTYNHIQAAAAILARIAFSGGQGQEPSQRLRTWRERDGLEDGALERAAEESANDTIMEIEQIIEQDGGFGLSQIRECLEREYLTGFQVGWIARARHDAKKNDEPVPE